MLKIMMLRKKLEMLRNEETQLRSKQAGFKTREGEIAAQVAAASTEEEVSAAAAAVEELEAAGAAGEGDGGNEGGEARSARGQRSGADFQRRCREFLRTGRMVYENARSMIKRAAVLSSSTGVVGPTGVGGINDAAGNTISDFIDLIKITDCTGMASYKVSYMTGDPEASAGTEGTLPNESEPTFGSVELKPALVKLIAYISREIRKQSPLQYESKVTEAVTRALRRMLSKMAVDAVLASNLNSTMKVVAASADKIFTPHLLSDIILAYGGDEGVDGAATLVLNKADLKAFAAVRGTNEFLPVYSIVPDTANPSSGVIKDNNGLSCRYCLNKNVTALSTATLSSSAKKGMFYGNPQCCEMGMWGGVEVTVNDGYKFGEGLLTVLGEVTASAGVTVDKGFVVVTAATA